MHKYFLQFPVQIYISIFLKIYWIFSGEEKLVSCVPFFKKKMFIGVSLVYNVVLVSVYSKVNQLYIYIYPLFLGFFSHIGHFRVLSRVPSAMQYVLVDYFMFNSVPCAPNAIFTSTPHFIRLFNYEAQVVSNGNILFLG